MFKKDPKSLKKRVESVKAAIRHRFYCRRPIPAIIQGVKVLSITGQPRCYTRQTVLMFGVRVLQMNGKGEAEKSNLAHQEIIQCSFGGGIKGRNLP